MSRLLTTRRGPLALSTYVPAVRLSQPLDRLIRPYLPRLAHAAAIGLSRARQGAEGNGLPPMITIVAPGLLDVGVRLEREEGYHRTPLLVLPDGEAVRWLDVVDLLERQADVAITPSAPIPPNIGAIHAYVDLVVELAGETARNIRRRDLPLLAAVPGISESVVADVLARLAPSDYAGYCVDLAPVATDEDVQRAVLAQVRVAAGERAVAVLGIEPSPATRDALYAAGVDLLIARAPLALAAEGRGWADPTVTLPGGAEAPQSDRLQLALVNLASATGREMPLSAQGRTWEVLHGMVREG